MALLRRKTAAKIKPGKLLVIDGIDGSGKSTQFKLLAETLRLAGYKVQLIKFPRHKQPPAYFVDRYLRGEYGETLNAQASSIFYAADRFDASFEIKQWLAQGYIVLVDRYVTANAGHQGSKIADRVDRFKFFRWLNDLEYKTFNLPKPDLNIILHMPPPLAKRLIAKRSDTDIHENNHEHFENAARSFVEISKLFPNTRLIDCTAKGRILTPQQIHGKVWELVRRIVLRNFPAQ